MGYINKHISLFEGANDERSPNIKVYCKNREESLEFEDIMHKNDWGWSSGERYIIRNYRDITEVTFYDFDRTNKTFTGRKCKIEDKDLVIYSTDKLGLVNKILNKKPSYEPRRIERTLESFIFKESEYDVIAFKVNSMDDVKRVVDVFYDVHGVENRTPKERIIKEFEEFYADGFTELLVVSRGEDKFDGIYPYELRIYRKADPKIYTVRDLRLFGATPTYTPKRITRTLEAVKYYPYRFKTEQEFIEAFGSNWRRYFEDHGPNWADEMDHLFGKDFPFEEKELNKDNVIYPIDFRWDDPESTYDWMISWNMLIKNKPRIPSYEPKKINRTLESVGEDFQFRYDTYKKELSEYRYLYVRINNNREIDEFYEVLKRSKNIRFTGLSKDIIDDWKKISHDDDNETFYFSFKLNTHGGFDVDYVTYDKGGLKTYPHWMMDISDRNMIELLFHINVAPNYNPRKIDRTLESTHLLISQEKYIRIYNERN